MSAIGFKEKNRFTNYLWKIFPYCAIIRPLHSDEGGKAVKPNAFKIRFSTTRIIMVSFILLILVGSLLLTLPISSANGCATPYVDALFTATTATCVTGLVTLPTYSAWSTFGHAVILFLIQIGGLGLITVTAGFIFLFKRRIRLSNRLVIRDAFNLNTLEDQGTFIRNVILGTLSAEALGAILYMTVFVPEMGKRGIWVSVFNAISAFCNAGMDIIGNDSLAEYVTNPVINGTTCFLIIIGGVGYVVWWDVIHTLGNCIRKKSIKPFRQLSLHSKLALTTTTILLLLGTLLIFMLEYNNPDTLGCLSIPHKLQAAFFQSVTTRTAGFYTVDQSKLGNAASMVSLILMFIGGSPVGTAGGVKTVTVAVLFASAMNTFRNRNEIAIFNRRIDKDAIRKAVAVTGMSLLITLGSTILLSAAQDANLLNILYETVSATATVGLSRNFTATLNLWGKLIIIVTMYLGRIGPISLAMAFILPKQNRNIVTNPTEEISVG